MKRICDKSFLLAWIAENVFGLHHSFLPRYICLNRMRSTMECTLELTQLRIGCHDPFDVAIYES